MVGYQIMERSRHTVTKYLNYGRTHAANIRNLFNKINLVNNALYEVELAGAEIEHKEPTIVRSFNLQYAKLRMLELYYKFVTDFCVVNKFEDLEMDTDSLYLALAEKELDGCVEPEVKAEREHLRSKDCTDSSAADAVANFVRENALTSTKNRTRES